MDASRSGAWHGYGALHSLQAAADIGQLLATTSAADQKRAQAAAATAALHAAGADARRAAARDAYIASLAQARMARPQSAAGGGKELFQRVKEAGVAGIIAFALVQTAFWAASVPVCVVAFSLVTGHVPDLSDQEEVAQFGAEALAFVNVARFAAPFRIGAALSAVPWVQANIVDRMPSLVATPQTHGRECAEHGSE